MGNQQHNNSRSRLAFSESSQAISGSSCPSGANWRALSRVSFFNARSRLLIGATIITVVLSSISLTAAQGSGVIPPTVGPAPDPSREHTFVHTWTVLGKPWVEVPVNVRLEPTPTGPEAWSLDVVIIGGEPTFISTGQFANTGPRAFTSLIPSGVLYLAVPENVTVDYSRLELQAFDLKEGRWVTLQDSVARNDPNFLTKTASQLGKKVTLDIITGLATETGKAILGVADYVFSVSSIFTEIEEARVDSSTLIPPVDTAFFDLNDFDIVKRPWRLFDTTELDLTRFSDILTAPGMKLRVRTPVSGIAAENLGSIKSYLAFTEQHILWDFAGQSISGKAVYTSAADQYAFRVLELSFGNSIEVVLPDEKPVVRTITVDVPDPTRGEVGADVMFLFDRSGSFSDDLDTFREKANEIVAALNRSLDDLRVGLGSFSDAPCYDFGDAGDFGYELDLSLNPSVSAFESAWRDIDIRDGNDGPESQLEAMYQAMTGVGRTINSGNSCDGGADIPASDPGWRAGRLPFLVVSTDANFHSPSEVLYPYPTASDDVIREAWSRGMTIFFLNSGETDAQARGIAEATGGAVYGLSADSSGVVDAIREAAGNAITSADIALVPEGDEAGFVQGIRPAVYRDVDLTLADTVDFEVTFARTLSAGETKRVFQFSLVVSVDGAEVQRLPVSVTISGEAAAGVEVYGVALEVIDD